MSEKKAPESSATFQRLRAETTIFGLLFYAFTHVSVSLERVPLLGIDIEGGAPKGALLLFIFLFWVFFLISWCVRFFADRGYEKRNDDGIQQFLDLLEKVPERSARWRLEDPDLIGDLREVLWRVQESNYGAPSSAELAEVLRQLTMEGGDQMMPPGRVSSFREDAIHKINLLKEKQENLYHNMTTKLDDARIAVQKLTDEVVASRNAVPEGVSALNESAKKILKELSNVKSASVLERITLGFWIPFFFTLFLVGISARQGLYEAAPTLSRIWECVTLQGEKCWLDNTADKVSPIRSSAASGTGNEQAVAATATD